MKVYALDCGTLTAPMAAFVEGEGGMATVPVCAFLIDHPKGLAVFDAGMPPLIRTDAPAAIGAFLAATFEAGFAPGAGLVEQLQAIDVDPARVDYVVNSHLHFDHGGGNALLPNAKVVVQRLEAMAAREEPSGAGRGYRQRDATEGRDVLEVEGEHDLFGDGSVVLLPTPGHTAGHQSARLRCDGGETVLAGDCCYFHRTLTDLKLPGFGHDREAQRRSIGRLRAMEDAGARIIPGHDADIWAGLPKVPLPMLGKGEIGP